MLCLLLQQAVINLVKSESNNLFSFAVFMNDTITTTDSYSGEKEVDSDKLVTMNHEY